jgi:hypothetical protein
MAIRKTQAPSTAKRVSTTAQVDRAAVSQKPDTLGDILAALKQAIAPGVGRSQWLSETEAKGIIGRAEGAGSDVASKLKGVLAEALQTGTLEGVPLTLGDAALQVIAAFTGVAPGAYRQASVDKDEHATHALAEGLVKAKDAVGQEAVVKTKAQLDEYKLQGQTGQVVSKSEFTPHFKAAKVIGAELKNALDAHLAENNPEAKAALDAIGPQVSEMVNGTIANISKDPEAMKRVSNVIAKIGTEGFADAVKSFGPDVGKAFTAATGVPMMNEGVVRGVLENFPKLVEKVAPEAAKGIAQTCANVGAKLGVSVAKEGAEAVAKTVVSTAAKEGAEAVAKTVAKSAVKEGAEAAVKAVATTAAKEGAEAVAKTGAKAAATAGKGIPFLGNLISVGSACLSAVGLVKELFKSPRDGEKIAKAGLNTLLQTVGIAFPWAALAGDVVDMGWSAKMAVSDARQGKAHDPGLTKQDAAGLLAGPAKLLASTLDGAGQGGIANSFRGLADAAEKAANATGMEKYQVDAISQFSSFAGNEISKAAADEQNPVTRDAMNTVAHGFGELFKVLYQHKKLKGEGGLKRDELQANLLKITGDVAMGMAAMQAGGKDAGLDVLGA